MTQALAPQMASRPLSPYDVAAQCIRLMLGPLQVLSVAPMLLFLVALTTMLFWHPDAPVYEVNRLTFTLVVLGVTARAVILRQQFCIERISWPMIGLTGIALASIISQPFDREAWSVLTAKYLVPFIMFHLAVLLFTAEKSLRHFETLSLVILAYLSFTAIAFLVGAHFLIFPRFILDPNLGYHADRARGPFLQAVANGVSLNLLGLLGLHAYLRGRLRGLRAAVLLASVPIAILATMTRAVWLSFAASLAALVVLSNQRAVRRAGLALAVIAGSGWALVSSSSQLSGMLTSRANDSQTVEFRQAVYAGSWQMFLDRPITGWGFHQMPLQLPRYVSGYEDKVLYPHNTYLEMLVENGSVGLALYVWLMWELWRLGRGSVPDNEQSGFLDGRFHAIWPILLVVYWVNGAVVVMSYQFVNALLFTMAGMLAAQGRRARKALPC